MKRRKARRDIQNIGIYTNLKQHLIFLQLEGVSINKRIASEFFTGKVSQDLKLK